jgi:hypothetical protein
MGPIFNKYFASNCRLFPADRVYDDVTRGIGALIATS